MEKSYFARSIDAYLQQWKAGDTHKPLLLRGARQVGKSSAVRHLGSTFRSFVEVNFERDTDVAAIFDSNLTPQEITARLAAFYDTPIVAGETLLFFDEIQACPKAIHSLWFFYENYPELHVIAAGSLLEFALKKMSSFGVGRVRSLFMYPMSFDEFLSATGHNGWIQAKREATPNKPLFEALHNKLVESFRTYLMVGGMPEAVKVWVQTKDYLQCGQVHADIIQAYRDDFSKYEEKVDPTLLRQTLQSVAQQVGSKFVYTRVAGDHRTEKVKHALGLLEEAGLVVPVMHTAANGIPLGASANDKFVKYLFVDSGLLLRLLGMESSGLSEMSQLILIGTATELVNKGDVTEMVAGLELLKYTSPTERHTLYYWQSMKHGAQAEVDYVIVRHLKIVPLEVKAGTSGSMKSLYQLLDEKLLHYGIRSSLENFGQLGRVEIIPLYALSGLNFVH